MTDLETAIREWQKKCLNEIDRAANEPRRFLPEKLPGKLDNLTNKLKAQYPAAGEIFTWWRQTCNFGDHPGCYVVQTLKGRRSFFIGTVSGLVELVTAKIDSEKVAA